MRTRHSLLRVLVSIGLLSGLGWWLDLGTAVSRLAEMRAEWVLLAVAISVAQVAVLAWRWHFTAGCLGVDLSFTAAWREYYLSIFLNQVLPGGVVGDVSRAWRQVRTQTRRQEPGGPAVRAVIFERLSAQAVMTTTAVVSLLALPVTANRGSRLAVVGAVAVAGLIVVTMGVWVRRQSTAGSLSGHVLADLGAAHLSGLVFAAQFVSALIVVGSYLATYVTAARAVGVDTPFPVLLPLVAPVLMTMLIPVTVAGWGLREGAAAVLWSAVGLTAADGVVVSVAYGLLVLIGSLPGALFLMVSGRKSVEPFLPGPDGRLPAHLDQRRSRSKRTSSPT